MWFKDLSCKPATAETEIFIYQLFFLCQENQTYILILDSSFTIPLFSKKSFWHMQMICHRAINVHFSGITAKHKFRFPPVLRWYAMGILNSPDAEPVKNDQLGVGHVPSEWKCRVRNDLQGVRNPVLLEYKMSRSCHMIVLNPEIWLGYPFSEHADSAQPRIGTGNETNNKGYIIIIRTYVLHWATPPYARLDRTSPTPF